MECKLFMLSLCTGTILFYINYMECKYTLIQTSLALALAFILTIWNVNIEVIRTALDFDTFILTIWNVNNTSFIFLESFKQLLY